jgi:hypothetical protein
MKNLKVKRKILIYQMAIDTLERHKPFEIRLPAGVKKVTGIIVTASLKQLDG